MQPGVRFKLSAMMFLQYAIWGAWAPILALHMADPLGFSGRQIGLVYGTMALASMIAPFIAGQIADRYFATERFLSVSAALGAVMLFIVWRQGDFGSFYWVMMAYAIIYAPTVALTNSLCFHHLTDREKQFPPIRLWGTIGWIVSGIALGIWLGILDPAIAYVAPGFAEGIANWRASIGQPVPGHCLPMAAGLSVVMAAFALFLPRTPPSREAENPWAFLGAVRLMKDRNFAVLICVSFAVATELGFYYNFGSIFFGHEQGVGLKEAWVAPAMTVGQMAEVVMLWVLPVFLTRFGIGTTIAVGIAAWPLRYLIFAIGQPTALVIFSQALHGVAWAFFFAASYIYVDSAAAKDIRASAQSLITFVTSGVGMYIGALLAGEVYDRVQPDFTRLFLVPVVITAACLIAFLFGFRRTARVEADVSAAAVAETDGPAAPPPTEES